MRDERLNAAVALSEYARPALPCTVTLTRIAPSNGLDSDNLLSSMKGCRDQVAAWLGVDDRDPRVTWAYDQRRGKSKQYAVEVAVHV